MNLVVHEGDEVFVEDLLLLIRHHKKPLIGLFISSVTVCSQPLDAVPQAVAPVRAVSTTRLSANPTSSGRMIS